MEIINCIEISNSIKNEIKIDLSKLEANNKPGIALVSFNKDKSSECYINNIIRECSKLDYYIEHKDFTTNRLSDDLLFYLSKSNEEKNINAIMLCRPIPLKINLEQMFSKIQLQKDIDGMRQCQHGVYNLEKHHPCTVKAIITILNKVCKSLKGLSVTIINDSNQLGKPLSFSLLKRGCTVTVCNIHTQNLNQYTRMADVLISATGQSGLIKGNMIKKDSIIIDVGISIEKGVIKGDVDFLSVKELTGKITTVPNGVGCVTTAILIKNTFDAWKRQQLN